MNMLKKIFNWAFPPVVEMGRISSLVSEREDLHDLGNPEAELVLPEGIVERIILAR